MRVRKSAYKHGVSKKDIEHAIVHAIQIFSLNDMKEPGTTLIVGPDVRGQLLEVIAANEITGEITVIHAMPLRKKFHYLLPKGKKND